MRVCRSSKNLLRKTLNHFTVFRAVRSEVRWLTERPTLRNEIINCCCSQRTKLTVSLVSLRLQLNQAMSFAFLASLVATLLTNLSAFFSTRVQKPTTLYTGHLSGKSGNVRVFDRCQGKVGEFQGNIGDFPVLKSGQCGIATRLIGLRPGL